MLPDTYEPTETSCDDLDNDCDGHTDEGCDCVPGAVRTCGTDAGECSTGTQTCIAGHWGPCENEVGPTEESCNGLDDDCDGFTDEAADLVPPDDVCPTLGVCEAATEFCAQGRWRCRMPEKYEDQETSCDGLDNDCDGFTDEDLTPPRDVCPTGGVCEDATPVCLGPEGWGCQMPETYEDQETSCDGLDNDCDGFIDEDITPPRDVCPTLGVCSTGTPVCLGEDGWDCLLPDNYEETETSCDCLDNDCDGDTDEGSCGLVVADREGSAGMLETPAVPGPDLSFGGFVIQAWVFVSSSQIGDGVILSRLGESGGWEFGVVVPGPGSVDPSPRVYFQVAFSDDTGDRLHRETSASTLELGAWSLLEVYYLPGGGMRPSSLLFQINGMQAGVFDEFPAPPQVPEAPITLGARDVVGIDPLGGGGDPPDPVDLLGQLHGMLDEVFVLHQRSPNGGALRLCGSPTERLVKVGWYLDLFGPAQGEDLAPGCTPSIGNIDAPACPVGEAWTGAIPCSSRPDHMIHEPTLCVQPVGGEDDR